jgi:uncharacterized RDD family membrane protein YckC
MKCPKCGYLGYERVERCRNCGYEFSLGSAAPTPELRLRDNSSVPQPLDDLELIDAATPAPAPAADRFNDVRAETPKEDSGRNIMAELPLFGPPITDDVPLITKASPPRPPLSVRRATPEVPRLRAEPRAPLLDWPDPAPTPPAPTARPVLEQPAAQSQERRVRAGSYGTHTEPAGIGSRAIAAAIDVALLGVVDAIVVYFTMKICRLTPADLSLLPKAPLITFLLLQNGGYFVAFTTMGQTLGKMVAGVRVLADDSDNAPDLGRSVLRAAVWLVLALPVGLGLLSATLSPDRRGLHDRFAGTRVVRASA